MDWNNDGRVDGRDYAHYKSVIDTGRGSSGSGSSTGESLDGMGYLIIVLIVLSIIEIIGRFWYKNKKGCYR